MLELWRIRALLADLVATTPDESLRAVGATERTTAELAASAAVEARTIGVARDGTPIVALGLAPSGDAAAPTVLVIGGPHGAAPTGTQAIVLLARRLRDDAALRALLGVRWWFVPCLDPAGRRENAAWWSGPDSIAEYARGLWPSPPAWRPDDAAASPEWSGLLNLVAMIRPQQVLVLYDAPAGGCALFAGAASWHGREADFMRLLDPLGVALDLGGAYGPDQVASACYLLERALDAASDPYALFHADQVRPVGRALSQLAVPLLGAVVTPLFVDYDRRERDLTPAPVIRGAVIADGVRLWREWFAFGRTALDLLAPGSSTQADTPAYRAFLDGLRGADTILAAGRHWPALVQHPDEPATLAETFIHGDAVRLARLGRLATLLRCLAQYDAGTATPLAEMIDRAYEMQTRWIDELAVPGQLRPLRRDQAVTAQLAALLLALP